jgi:hypothetical protein
MKKFLEPLVIFVTGNLFLLVAVLLFPALGAAQTKLASDTAAHASVFWGWSWVVTGTRLFAYLAIEGGILWATAKSFLGLRDK